MKKIILIFLSMCIFVSALSLGNITAYADEKDIYEYLLEKTADFETEVDIAPYVKSNSWDIEDIKSMIKDFFLSEPTLFYVGEEKGISYSADLSKVYLIFEYDYTKDEVNAMQKEMKKAAQKAVASITDDMTDVEKALVVHDYLVMNCDYDHESHKRTAYDCLVNKEAVCQGYSLAFLYIMRDFFDIECSIVYSDSQNHSWNYVKIGKSWFHVDVTADDPTFTSFSGKSYDGKGEILHENFMLSDKAIKKSSGLHRKWETMGKPAASNEKYDDYFWRSSTSAMYKIDGLWYYTVLDKSSPGVNYKKGGDKEVYTKLCTYDFETKKSTELKKIEDMWTLYRNSKTGKKIDGLSWYKKSYMKLVQVGDYLYYNTSEAVYRFNPETGKTKKVYTLKKEDMQIFSMVPYGSSAIRLVYKKDLSYSNKYIKLKIS